MSTRPTCKSIERKAAAIAKQTSEEIFYCWDQSEGQYVYLTRGRYLECFWIHPEDVLYSTIEGWY